MSLEQLKNDRAEKLKLAQSIITGAQAMGRDLNDDEAAKVEALHGEATELKTSIEQAESRKKLADEIAAEAEGLNQPEQPKTRAKVSGVRDLAQDDPALGFKSPADYFKSVMRATAGDIDSRLKPLAAAGGDEHSGQSNPHGGFLIPKAFAPGLLEVAPEDDPTASRVMDMPMESSRVVLPYRVDKDHSDSVSGGFRFRRRVETQKTDTSRGEFGQLQLNANSLTGVSFATNELIQDSPLSVAALIQRGFAQELGAKLLDEKLNGTGVGMFLGVNEAPCTITIAKESAQAADTIVGANVVKMRARCWGYSRAIWLANHDMYPQISKLHQALTNDDVPLFVAGNGVDVPDTLLGRPIFFTEFTNTLGDKGDIVLGNWAEYIVGTRMGMEMASSIHVRFENSEQAFKAELRNDGKPWWDSALTPRKGANALSPFVNLAARA